MSSYWASAWGDLRYCPLPSAAFCFNICWSSLPCICLRRASLQSKGSREEAEALVGLEVYKALGHALKITV